MMITLKSGEKMNDLVALAKSLIEPQDLRNGGELKPQDAARLITMLFKDDFLSKITTVRMERLIRNIDVMEILRRQLVRLPQGKEPEIDDLTGADEHGSQLTALPAQLFATLTLDFLRENRNNPELQKEIEKSFSTIFANDIVDLGFNGIADDGVGATREERFLRLNKGWFQILRDAEKAPKVEIDPASDGWVASLKAVLDASDDRVRATSSFIMNEADADEYAEEINAPVSGHEVQSAKPARRFRGKTIETHPSVSSGTICFTPLKNLVYGINNYPRRDRAYHNRRRALEFTFDTSFDFQVAVKQFAVLGEKPAA